MLSEWFQTQPYMWRFWTPSKLLLRNRSVARRGLPFIVRSPGVVLESLLCHKGRKELGGQRRHSPRPLDLAVLAQSPCSAT